MTQPKKINTGIALIAPEDVVYEPWTSKFGEDGMGYIKMMSHPNRYVTEARGEEYTAVEPHKNYIGSSTAPSTMQEWMEYAKGDVVLLVDAAVEERKVALEPLEALGISKAPIVMIGSTPGIASIEREKETLFDHMTEKEWKKANRQLNRDERKLNRDERKDARIEQAIAKKFGSAYNPGNRAAVHERFMDERDRIDQMRKLLNG